MPIELLNFLAGLCAGGILLSMMMVAWHATKYIEENEDDSEV